MKLTFYLFFLGILLSGKLNACSCPNFGSFCSSVSSDEQLVLAVLTARPNFYSMEIAIIDDVSNTGSDTIKVLGQDGLNCGESLDVFEIGDTVLFALDTFIYVDPPNNEKFEWYLEGCGRHYLEFKNNKVEGNIYDKDEFISLAYEDFVADTSQCFLSTSISELTKEQSDQFTIFPNPVQDVLYVKTLGSTIENSLYEIIDIQGRIIIDGINLLLGRNEVNVSSLAQGGIYFLRSRRTGETSKFLKL